MCAKLSSDLAPTSVQKPFSSSLYLDILAQDALTSPTEVDKRPWAPTGLRPLPG